MDSTVPAKQLPADVPAYSPAEAWRYLRVPVGALQCVEHVEGGGHPGGSGTASDFTPCLARAVVKWSFRQLVNIHILSVIARWEEVGGRGFATSSWPFFRAIQGVIQEPPREAGWRGKVGDDLIDSYLRASRLDSALAPKLRHLLDLYLSRVEWDPDGSPSRLFPLTRPDPEDAPKNIAIDPRIRFGRPVLLRRGIPTDVVRGRFQGGDSVASLADDFNMDVAEVEEVLRYEGDHDS